MTLTMTPGLAWTLLLLAGLLEVVWVMTMKASAGFTRPGWAVATMVAAGLSFWLLGLAMKLLPAGTAYPVWVGIGAVGAFIFGIVFFHEPAGLARIACVGLIVLGIVGLKLLSPH
jgi:quaternary ammonium compound-resistance protein SugE